jgi:hypothetical protein
MDRRNSWNKFQENAQKLAIAMPQDIQAERALLFEAFVNEKFRLKVFEALGEFDDDDSPFTYDHHIIFYKALHRLHELGEKIDLVPIAREIERLTSIADGHLSRDSILALIQEITTGLPKRGNEEEYLNEVIEDWQARRIVLSAQRAIGLATNRAFGVAAAQEELRAIVVETTAKLNETEGEKGKWIFTGTELLEMPLEKPPCLIEPILQTTGFSLLIGESDIGKTWLALGLLLAVASGQTEWLGYMLNTTHQRAILISTEDSESNLAGRLRVLQETFEPTTWRDRVKVLIADDKSNDQIIRKLEELTNAEPVDLIVADCLGDLFDGRDGNSQADARRWFKQFVMLSKDCHFMILHHKGKRLADKTPHKDHALGSQAFEGKARTVLDLTEYENNFYLSVLKCKTSRDQKKNSKRLEFDERTLVFLDTGETVERGTIGAERQVTQNWEPYFHTDERMKKSELAKAYMKEARKSKTTAYSKIDSALKSGELCKDSYDNILLPGVEDQLQQNEAKLSGPSDSLGVLEGLDNGMSSSLGK